MSFLTNPKVKQWLEEDARIKNQFERKAWHFNYSQEHQIDLLENSEDQENADKYLFILHLVLFYNGGLINFFKIKNDEKKIDPDEILKIWKQQGFDEKTIDLMVKNLKQNQSETKFEAEKVLEFLVSLADEIQNCPLITQIDYHQGLFDTIKFLDNKNNKIELNKVKTILIEKYRGLFSYILSDLGSYTFEEINSYWRVLERFVDLIDKTNLPSIKDLLLKILQIPLEKSDILQIVVLEFSLPRIDWFSTNDDFVVINEVLFNLTKKLNFTSVVFSRLLESISRIKNAEKITNLIDILNIVLDKAEENLKSDKYNWALVSSILNTLYKTDPRGIFWKIDNLNNAKAFKNRFNIISQENNIKTTQSFNKIEIDLTDAANPIIEYLESLKKENDIGITEKLIFSANLLGDLEQYKKTNHPESVFIQSGVSKTTIDQRYIGSSDPTQDEKYISQLHSTNSLVIDLIFKTIVKEISEEEFVTLFDKGYRNAMNDFYISTKYKNLENISKMYFTEQNYFAETINNLDKITETEKELLIYRSNTYLESISTKFEVLIRIIHFFLTQKHELNPNNAFNYTTQVSKLLLELLQNEKIKQIKLTGFLEYLNYFLYNEKDGWRHFLAHGFTLEYTSSFNLGLITKFWTSYLILLSLLNSLKIEKMG